MKLTAPRVTALAASAFIGCALLAGCSSSDDASADCSIVGKFLHIQSNSGQQREQG